MVTRNGYYYTEEFAVECGRIGIIATAIKDADGKPTGKYEMMAGELFISVLNKYGLLNRRFVCAKFPQVMSKSKTAINKETKLLEVKSSSVRTYQCPVCKLNMRGTKSGIRIKCCNEKHVGIEPLMVEITKKKNETDATERNNGTMIEEK